MSANTVRTAEVIKAEIAKLEAELSALKAAEKAAKVVTTVSDETKKQIMLAIHNDPKTTNGKYYTTFAAFIISNAEKKYQTTSEIKVATWVAAAKGYGIAIK